MGSLLGMDFEREGRGVPEDGSRANGFIRFFQIAQRKFWGMIKLNIMQAVCCLPAFAVSGFIISYMYMRFMPENVEYDLAMRFFVAFLLVDLQLVTVGPLQAGFIYTMRNYAREENVFVWSDFIKGVKENWKRATAVCLIDLAAVLIASYTYMFYSVNAGETGPMGEACKVIMIVFAVLYAMMHIYIFPMMVTLDLTVKKLYGNALRFAVAKFFPNLAILAIMAAFDLLVFTNILVGLFFILLVGYALTNFLSTFYAYGAIDKYIIRKIKA